MTGIDVPAIHIAVALLSGPDGRLLLVRKRGTRTFIQPGGKIEAGEAPVEALIRELHEELGLRIPADEPVFIGRFAAPAANEAGRDVIAEIFRLQSTQVPVPAAEIEECIWFDPDDSGDIPLAPLIRDQMMTLYRTLTW